MRSWESKDIVDILIAHHKELLEESIELLKGDGSFREGDRLDDKCIVIENFLEDTFGIEWTGLKFIDSHKNLI